MRSSFHPLITVSTGARGSGARRMADKARRAGAGRREKAARLGRRIAELEESYALERRLVEELCQSGDLFRSITDTANDAIMVMDYRGILYYINEAAERLFGYQARELEGRRLHDVLVPEERRENAVASFEQQAASGMQGVLGKVREFEARRKDGGIFPVEVSVSQCTIEGQPHYISICRDISERKRIELEIKESRRRYRDLVENLNDVVYNLDPLGLISYISPSIERITSYSAQELIGQPFTHFIHPDDLPELLEDFKRTLAGELKPAGFRLLDRDGRELYVRTSSRPLYRNGELMGLTGVLTDFTGRKKAEEELERYRRHLEEMIRERTEELEKKSQDLMRSEKYFRALIENAFDAIAVLDAEGKIKYLSPSLERASGSGRKTFLGADSLSFIHPGDLPAAREALSDITREPGRTGRVEYRWRFGDESWRWHQATAMNLLHDPVVHGVVVNAHDITERKKAEEAMRESEERYRILVETSPDPIIFADLKGTVLMANRSGAETLGYGSPDEMLGMRVFDLIAPEDRGKASRLMRDRTQSGRGVTDEYTLIRKDGSRRSGEITATLIRDGEGKPWGFIGITRDITDRKRAEERLRKLNQCFLSLGPDPLENIRKLALTGKEIIDADLVRYGRMEKGNVFYFTSDRAEEGFIPLEDVEDFVCQYLLSSGIRGPVSSQDLERSVFERDPEVRRLGMRSALMHPIYMLGEGIGCLCAFTHESKSFSEVEKDLLATLGRAIGIEEERRAFNESLRDFVDIASHELRHPVTLLAGFADTLDANWEDMDEPTRRESVDAIRQTADRLNRLAKGLLDTSLVERERFSVEKKSVDLGSLMESAVAEMRFRYRQREFSLAVAEGVGKCELDPDRVRDLMVILLDNAVKYSPEGTEIEVVAEAGEDAATVSVLDRGIGVPEEHREHIFKRFYMVEKAKHHSKPGLGLGLFLARQIVEAHGGTIRHEPREGGGSALRFTLPLR